MKIKMFRTVLIMLLLVVTVGTVTAGAVVPYTTYTYNYGGLMQRSPHVYVSLTVVDSTSLVNSLKTDGGASMNAKILYAETFKGLNSPKDIFVDDLNHVYIADTANNQIVVTDENYNLRLVINTFINAFGVPDKLSSPNGVFVTESEVYVADTDNSRVVVFDKLGNFVDIVPEPASEVMPEDSVYKPVAVAVDSAGRIYVVSSTTNYGVVSLNRDGSFNGFIGPQKVTYSAFDYFWRSFQTEKQLAASEIYVPTEYNNLTIDDDDFIYVTTSSIDEGTVASTILSRSKSGQYAIVKKLNPNGSDVMNRNGFWPPAGEIDFQSFTTSEFSTSGPSTVVDVALGPNGTWSIVDNKRSRVFTYDSDGNLLFAFGDKGDQVGSIQTEALVAIDYQDTNILLLDRSASAITVYKRTDYGDLLAAAIQNTLDKQYNKAVEYYISILQRNNNYDTAYVGIGQSMYRNGDYLEAMQYYKYATDTKNYSEAYKEYRKEWFESYLLWVVAGILIVIILIAKFFKFAKIYNKKNQKTKEKRGFFEEVMYGFHIIFHPFDGFWDLKYEKRGSVRGATFWLAVTALVFVYQSTGKGYLANPAGGTQSYFFAAMSIILPVVLWTVANWCLTTLFDGEGTLKDVYIATCYSLVPLAMLLLPAVMFTNFVTAEELALVGMISDLAYFWFGILVFFGMMVTHDYTLGKNVLTTLGAIVGVAFIMFIGLLFANLLQRIFTFGYNIYVELSYRWS